MNQVVKISVGVIVKLIILFALLFANETTAQRKSTSVNVKSDGKTTISIKNGFGNNFSVEYKGDITLTDDDKDIAAISRGGYMEIKKSAFGNRRRIFMEPDNAGGLIKKYYVGGRQKSFDAEGKQWLAEILLEVVRSTTLGAEKRVDRMYRTGGYYPVLKEVDAISSDYVQSHYIKLLLENKLDEKGLLATLKRVGKIDSDHHRADILKRNANIFLAQESTTTAYIAVTGAIDSDHHTAEVLKRALGQGSLSGTQLNALLGVVEDIDSDHHKASVLMQTLDERDLSDANVKLLLRTASTIDSDHHRATVLKQALSRSSLGTSSQQAVLAAVADMDSDHHMDNVLSEMLENALDEDALGRLFYVVETEMSSDMHRAAVLRRAIDQPELKPQLEPLLEALGDINSDHHKAEVFRALSKEHFSDSQLIQILKATESIGSDHHHAESLIQFAADVANASTAVKDAYIASTQEISSDSHMGRAMRAIR